MLSTSTYELDVIRLRWPLHFSLLLLLGNKIIFKVCLALIFQFAQWDFSVFPDCCCVYFADYDCVYAANLFFVAVFSADDACL